MNSEYVKNKLPFKLTGSSADSPYQKQLSSSFGRNVDLVNMHIDTYAGFEELPIQSPFTNQHVGGNQHRHINLNLGTDNKDNRAESFIITVLPSSSLRIYAPDYYSKDRPRAQFFKGTKSSVNISNIKDNFRILGNFSKNYEIFQTVGRRNIKNLINDNFTASGPLTTQFINGANNYLLPQIENNSKSVFVERFSAPGGKNESSRGSLDREGEEYSPNNSLTTRNISIRQPYYKLLTNHTAQFGSSSLQGVSEHKINRNPFKRLELSGSTVISSSQYDNFWIQHAIPQNDFGYAWITASTISDQYTIGASSLQFSITSSIQNIGEIDLDTQTIMSSLSGSDQTYSTWKQIRGYEHPVALKLRKNNFISVEDPVQTKKIRFNNNTFINVASKRSETSTNYREPPLTTKYKPLQQDFLLKTDTEDNIGHKLKYTFANNDSAFANKELNQRLTLEFNRADFYEKMLDLQKSDTLTDEQKPFKKLLGITYSETVYPREENTFLADTRGRTAYTLEEPGFTINGYDIDLGEQRNFWRKISSKRKRSRLSEGGYYNSLGYISTEESGSNFADYQTGIVTDNKFVIVSGSYVQSIGLDSGLFNSVALLESGSAERDVYSYFGNISAERYISGSYLFKELYNTINKRGYVYDVSGEWNKLYNDFYEEVKNKSEQQKRSIGVLYRNTSFKSLLTALPTNREQYIDLAPRTEDEELFTNPKPKYVSFVGGFELNTGSYVQNQNNFTNNSEIYLNSLNNTVHALHIAGNKLYAGGDFTSIDGNISGNHIALWDGTNWNPIKSGVNGPVYSVFSVGNKVYIGGDFSNVDGNASSDNIVYWNTSNSTWNSIGKGTDGAVYCMALSGTDLYVGGTFLSATNDPGGAVAGTRGVARLNTSTDSWTALNTGLSGTVYDILISGTTIYAVGDFTNINGVPEHKFISKRSTTAAPTDPWESMVTGALNDIAKTLALSGNTIFVGGNFTNANNTASADFLASWNTVTNTWSAVDSGLTDGVEKLIVSGNDLYIGGRFSSVSGNPSASYIVKRDLFGSAWYALDNGTNYDVYDLKISGSDLYVGGSFTMAGGVPHTVNIAKWDTINTTWSEVTSQQQTLSFSLDYFSQSFSLSDFYFSTLDNGLQKNSNLSLEMSPAYDSYEDYSSDIRFANKDYSVIPEFRISEHMKYYVSQSNGNFRTKNNSIFEIDGVGETYRSSVSESSNYDISYFKNYLTTDILTKNKKIEVDYSKDVKVSNLTLKCKGIKKLLPYNGFYPQQRTIQLASLYSDYVNNNLHGGTYNLHNINDYSNKKIISNITASSINVTKLDNKYYLAVGSSDDGVLSAGNVTIYESNGDTVEDWNSSSIATITPSGSGGNIHTNFGQNVKFISSSAGLTLFINATLSGSENISTSGSGYVLYATSSNGQAWSSAAAMLVDGTPNTYVSGTANGSLFGYYYDALYTTLLGKEKVILAIGSPYSTVSGKTNCGEVYIVTGTLSETSKVWQWSDKSLIFTGSAPGNRAGTGVSLMSCSSGFQVYIGELFGDQGETNAGNIWFASSSNGLLNSWSIPTFIAKGTHENCAIGLNNIKAVNFNNKTYVFFSEPFYTGSSAGSDRGAVYVMSSSNNNIWTPSSFAQKITLIDGINDNDYILNIQPSYSIEAAVGENGRLYYSFANKNNSPLPAQLFIGNTKDGLTWQTNDNLLIINNTYGASTLASTLYNSYGISLPVFFTNFENAENIWVIKNNIFTEYSLRVSGSEKYFKHAALEPLMSPGILYNTIKSGIAVDWACITGSQTSIQPYGPDTVVNAYYPKAIKMIGYSGSSIFQSAYGLLRSNIDYRIPFENLLFPDEAFEPKDFLSEDLTTRTVLTSLSSSDPVASFLDKCYIYGGYEPYISPYDFGDINNLGPKRFSVPFVYRRKDAKNVGLYTLAMSNFLAETVKFFLKDEKLITFTSSPDYKWKEFKSGKTYYMDVVLEKSSDLIMMEAYHSDLHPLGANGEKMNGRYFGYPVNKTNKDLWSGEEFTEEQSRLIHNDPAYAPYTPPYFEGTARARISFKPTVSRQYTFQEILERAEVENVFIDLSKSAHTGSDAYINKMPIGSSVDLFGEAQSVNIKINTSNSSKDVTENIDSKIWIISPKMETPVLDFSEQSLQPYINNYSKSGGFGKGMWSGIGKIPNGGKGIKLRLEYPYGRLGNSQTTASLLEQVGFKAEEKIVGRIADNKVISEAIVAIPYLENANEQTVKNNTGFNFIAIDKNMFSLQNKNIENGEPAISAQQFEDIEYDIASTSISDMIQKIKKYVIPPEFNFYQYSDIEPFVMYIFEFQHTLEQNDLANIWQGVMPKIAYNAEKDEVNINHRMDKFEFFGGKEIPDNLKWLVFKVKRRAEINYFNVTATSKDDQRFNFNKIIGRSEGTDAYSYNWPYDFFSLVELAKIEVEIDYEGEEE